MQRDRQADGKDGIVIHLVAGRLWDWSADLDRIADLDTIKLTNGRGDEVRTDPGDRRVAQHVRKALQSAIANAENNHQLDVDRLFVKEASVGKGLVMRRFHPRARGRASAILKPFSHIVIIVGERGEAA